MVTDGLGEALGVAELDGAVTPSSLCAVAAAARAASSFFWASPYAVKSPLASAARPASYAACASAMAAASLCCAVVLDDPLGDGDGVAPPVPVEPPDDPLLPAAAPKTSARPWARVFWNDTLLPKPTSTFCSNG